jgi:N-acetyl-gamma-glutamyl-phosphate reductase
MIRIGIVGATGYTALELIKILRRHSDAQVTRLTSRGDIGTPISATHPGLRGQLDVALSEFCIDDFEQHVDCAFCCLPHAASSPVVKQLVDRGIRTIDFSADYRLNDLASFEQHYQAEHADPERLGQIPYGIPELFREQITGAKLVANPGCFPTSVILPLTPLIRQGLILGDDIIVDSKTGVSGGGRTPKLAFHYPECNESVTAYAVGTHRHGPEMEQIIGRASGVAVSVGFVPHLVPMDRGILSTIYVKPARHETTPSLLLDALSAFYRDEPFVRVTDSLPTTKDVSGTNFCDVTVRRMGGRIVIVAAIDNLIKGASGAAVQNMNVLFGLPEKQGLM